MCHTVKQSMLHSSYIGEHPQQLKYEKVYPRKTRKKFALKEI